MRLNHPITVSSSYEKSVRLTELKKEFIKKIKILLKAHTGFVE